MTKRVVEALVAMYNTLHLANVCMWLCVYLGFFFVSSPVSCLVHSASHWLSLGFSVRQVYGYPLQIRINTAVSVNTCVYILTRTSKKSTHTNATQDFLATNL